ncbi:hypothetical protein EHS25_000740 [Saitozyma podzolica]|uniref:Yeast cell wall synthesis Kre9/Knh1-like N-terminal domain-containing protein n=1 Tax=Saitozyma podzolica TaxID=1890683 RepID=A0A427YX34_9TREE|nr:hypothetical protein EHS25_000740 [Saitozyma podzolica]
MHALSLAASLLPLLGLASAIVTPTSPDATTVVKQGDQITALWTADPTGTWKNVGIQLMTGDNLDMIALETLATGIDGTTTTSFSAAAPAVSPNAAIYFLQFTNGGDMTNVTWTTRFTIAGADGSSTQPTNSTVYSGTTVAWGTGVLLDSNSTAAVSGVTSASASASAAASTGLTIYTSLSSTAAAAAVVSGSASVSASASASASKTSASAATSSKSSAGRVAVSGLGALLAGVLGVAML